MYLERTNDRRLPEDYTGDILLWDIDKTYLETHFSSWRGLLAIPFEFAIDKSPLPGAVPLLRALRHGPGDEPRLTPLYFVSGSPPELRPVITKRMILDGVEYDGITFKDQLGLLLAGRVREITRQVGYKLEALLRYRLELPAGARWLCFGDDVESDAEIFALFGEVCAGLRGGALDGRLRSYGVHADQIRECIALAERLPITPDPVERIFIHLSGGSDPARFDDPRVVAAYSYLQTALVLLQMERIRPEAVTAVAKDLRRRRIPEQEIRRQLLDANVRFGVPLEWSLLTAQR
ncbi:MAG: hypothetical protein D6729_18025 [Deltaproteobacteria bacterium]|nr:MAG: hypothetical protein D6729_18025 [Deltaproteobacteria bacterium]